MFPRSLVVRIVTDTLTVSRSTTGGRSIRINTLAGNESRVEFQEGGTAQWSVGNYATEHSFVIGTGGNLIAPKLVIEKKGSIRAEADSYTKLLIHSDTTDGVTTFVDSSPSGHTVTATNALHKTAQKKFGATSMYFDGSGSPTDFLKTGSSSEWAFSGDFTVDLWVNPQDTGSGNLVGDYYIGSVSTSPDWQFSYQGANQKVNFWRGSSIATSSDNSVPRNQWTHVAIVRSGSGTNNCKVYVNGRLDGQGTFTTTVGRGLNIWVGIDGNESAEPYLGYMDEIRVSHTARWTSSFTPPTRPYATVNDEFFADQDKISTLGFGTPLLRVGALDGPCYDFDGAADYITGDDTGLPSGNTARTISAWINPSSTSVANRTIFGYGTDASYQGWGFDLDGDNLKVQTYAQGASAVSTGSIVVNKWQHVAATYDGTTVTYYIDGVASGTATFLTQTPNTVPNVYELGRTVWASGRAYFAGQIRDVKVFPSALNSGEIAQLYNGYNPKKNLQVELIANGDFSSSLSTGWGVASGTIAISGGECVFSGENGIMYQSGISITTGKTYLLSLDYDVNSADSIRVAPAGVGLQVIATSGAGSYSLVFVGGGVNLHFYGYMGSGESCSIDNVSIVEVTTLVDLNSRSASPATWHNSAIPALYNGTVNGASMSAGSTDRYAAGDFRAVLIDAESFYR